MSSHPSTHPERPQRSPRRVRLLVLATGLAALVVLARAMLSTSPPALAEHAGGFVLAAFALLLLGSLLQRLRRLWHTHLRSALVRVGAALWAWSGAVWPRGEPDDVAYCVLYLASDESKFVTGAEFRIDGGLAKKSFNGLTNHRTRAISISRRPQAHELRKLSNDILYSHRPSHLEPIRPALFPSIGQALPWNLLTNGDFR